MRMRVTYGTPTPPGKRILQHLPTLAMAWLNSVLMIGLVIVSSTTTSHGQEGVFLSLKGQFIANDSYVDVDDIGSGGDALLCHTNKTDCCGELPNRAGEWYPGYSEDTVGTQRTSNYEFYRDRGPQVVRLNRRKGFSPARGRFRCEVPDANYNMQTRYVNIVDIGSVTISESDLSLVCSANIYPPALYGSLPVFEWFFGPNNSSLPSDVVSNGTKLDINSNNYTNTLQFTSLRHIGIYTCRIGYSAASIIILDSDPIVDIMSDGTQTAGGNYSLMCMVTGVRNDNLMYNWTKDNGTAQSVVSTSSTLFFSPLKLSDAGQYLCKVMIGSQMYGTMEYINIEIPAPMLISVTSNPASPIRPIGSAVTLICTVVLSPAVDVPVTINIHLSDPDESPLTTTTPSVSGSTYTSTAMVNSFGREDSGLYMCRASISSNFPFIGDSKSISVASKVTIGVYLSLKGNIYPNNSVIFVNEIGESDDNSNPIQNDALQCITDKSPCCKFFPNTAGEWFFPNGTLVPEEGADTILFYRNRGFNDGTVNLNRISTLSTVSVPTGLFCCVLPDMDGISQRLCADIDHVVIIIATSGNNTGGETYSLECSVSGGHSAQFQWFNESETDVTGQESTIITSSPSSSILEFSPLHQSHGGTYTCSANVSDTVVSKSVELSIKAPTVTIQITGGEITPNIGHEYTLTCSIFGAENLNAMLAYEWRNEGQLLSNSSVLQLPSLKLSDAGRYTCQVSVASSYLHNSITATESHNLVIKIPDPLSVHISYNKVSPIRPIGFDVILTCTVELSTLVNVPVIVTTVWTGPAGFRNATSTSQPAVGSNNSYTNAVTIRSFGRIHSGQYTCAAQVNSSQNSEFYVTNIASVFGAAQITVGVYLTLNGRVYANNSIITKAEIAETANGLQCVTDKMPCCQMGPRVGGWYFPNGSVIPEGRNHTTFFVSRGDNGTVNLNHVDSSNVSSPSGRFCCEVPDANGLGQTQCALLIHTLSVNVTSKGNIITGGQAFSLKCIISGVEALNPILTYQWTKSNSTGQMQVGSNTSTLSFSSLRLSDAGQYSCQVIVSSRYLRDALNVTSAPFDVHLQVPEPIVRLVSDTPNPILSGSSPTLTCAVELSPAVDVPVTVNTEWTGPDGSTLTSGAPPVMKSFTHYTSKAKLNYVESADSGNYTCTVSIGGKIRASVSKIVVMGDGMFQIRLKNADICQPRYKNVHPDMEAELYKYHIEEALTEAIESRCECHLPRANLLKATFSCGSSPNLTTYRNTLIGTHNFNATQLIEFIQDWVTSEPQINIKDYAVWLDSSCPVAIASLKEPECGEVRHCPCANDPNVIKCMEFLGDESFFGCINSCI